MKKDTIFSLAIAFGLNLLTLVNAQVIMFDDFNYNSINDAELTSFNKWKLINGVSGPPEGGLYQSSNVDFKADPNNAGNKIMTLATTVNGQTNAITHSRIETDGFEYFEGTYAARVYYSDTPHDYGDANIQTFYTIVGSNLSGDGTKYSELDFEYMASDKWGISADNEVMYLTSWNRYIANPWQAWKRYWSEQRSYEGWHTFVVTCTDGVNVNYYIDGQFITSMATTDNDGTSVYPRSPMQVAFANWVWNSVIGNSNDVRTTTMEVDWVLFQRDTELSTTQVDNLVSSYRTSGLVRRNLLGQTKYETVGIQQGPYDGIAAVIPGVIEAEKYDVGGEGVAYYEAVDDGINQGGSTFRSDGVDIQDISAGNYNIGYIGTGEWLEYTVNVTSTDVYEIAATVANGGTTDAIFHLEIDGNTIGQNGVLGNTGPWSTWTSLSLGQASLPQGEHIIRLYTDQATYTLDKITFSVNQPPTVSVTSNSTTYEAPADITLTATANDVDGDIVKVEFYNGETLLGTDQTLPYEYTWLNVGEGIYTVTSKAYDDKNKTTTSASIIINVTVPQGPYDGAVAVIPGVIEAEKYDVGGEGVSYHEAIDDGINQGGSTFRSDGVDIQDISTGNYNIGYIGTGEWLEYTVNVTSTDIYDVAATVANGGATDAIFHLEIDGNTIGQNGVLGNTGPWSTWTSLSLGQASLPQGEHIIRLYTDQATYTIDKITFSKATITDVGNPTTSDVFDIYPNPVEEILRIKSEEALSGKLRIFDSKGQQVMYKEISNKLIDVSGLDAGVYMVEFIYNDKVVVKNFVKN